MRRRLVLVLAWLKPCPSLNLCGCDLLGLASFQSTSKIKVKSRGQECPRHTRNPSPHLPARRRRYLRAAAGASAAHALVATAVAHHDGAAERATGSVAHVDHAGERVGGMDGASRWSLVASRWAGTYGAVQIADTFRSGRAQRSRTQVVEQHLLLSAEEAQVQPAEDGVHDRLGIADFGMARPAAGLKARVRELFAEEFQRHAVLQRDRDGQRKAVHEPRHGRAFLRHLDEDLAGFAVGIQADDDVAFVASDVELVRDRHALFFQTVTHGARWSVEVVL